MDIKFNTSYGDISLDTDLQMVVGDPLIIQRVIQVLKTNYGDYALNPMYGADIDSFIGRGIDNNLALELQESLVRDLKAEGIENFRLPYVIGTNTIHFRLIIPGSNTINLDFVKDKGFRIE